MSGQHARTLAPEPRATDYEDFLEPDPGLVSLVERVAGKISTPDEGDAQKQLLQRDLAIELLHQRVLELETDLGEARQTLRSRELELEQLKQRVSATVQSEPVAFEAPEALAPVSEPAEQLAAPAHPEVGASPVLERVSVALRMSLPPASLPPPSRPDSIPPSRRRQPRHSCELELEFTDETHFYAGLTQDLSQGGVFIATYHVFPVGSRLELGFQLPGGAEVRVRGVVRWVRGEGEPGDQRPGMGVAFTELSDSALLAIAGYCRQRAPLYMEF